MDSDCSGGGDLIIRVNVVTTMFVIWNLHKIVCQSNDTLIKKEKKVTHLLPGKLGLSFFNLLGFHQTQSTKLLKSLWLIASCTGFRNLKNIQERFSTQSGCLSSPLHWSVSLVVSYQHKDGNVIHKCLDNFCVISICQMFQCRALTKQKQSLPWKSLLSNGDRPPSHKQYLHIC